LIKVTGIVKASYRFYEKSRLKKSLKSMKSGWYFQNFSEMGPGFFYGFMAMT
jgi:hypothetical protein